MKASDPISVTDDGMVTVVSAMQRLKAPQPICVTFGGDLWRPICVTVARDEQPWNAQWLISVRDSGRVTSTSELQKTNANMSSSVMDWGSVAVTREVQASNACAPTTVTDVGNVIEISEVQPLKE